MKKTTHSALHTVVTLLTVLALLLGVPEVSAFAVTQHDVDVLAAERDRIRALKQSKQAEVDRLMAEQADVRAQKQALDERNAYTQDQINLTRQEIELYSGMIADKQLEVEAAQEEVDTQLALYRTRVRAMEENGGYNVLDLVLNTTDLGELLTNINDINDIMTADRELEESLIAARQHHERVKAEYEQTKKSLEEKIEQLNLEIEELERQSEEAAQLIIDYESRIDLTEEEVAAYAAEEQQTQNELNDLFNQLEAQRAAEEAARRAAAAAAGTLNQGGDTGSGDSGTDSGESESSTPAVVGSGSFSWPCPSCTYVTSRMGNRYHPIFSEWRYHSGMDIGASYGSSVIASDSGTICYCGEKGGYGNCIMIDHGNGYYTLYGHLSGYAVSYEQTVTKGQTIGYVGSSGWATGPHLHFEIRSGSTALDPEAVAGFSGLTYAADAGE